jgi:hypothetical protein
MKQSTTRVWLGLEVVRDCVPMPPSIDEEINRANILGQTLTAN